MTCRNVADSPKFKNACLKPKHSPQELKDKMRKNYKEKVKNCRDMLLDRFRGPVIEEELSSRLTEIYKSMFNHTAEVEIDEIEMFEEIKNELVQEELEWWLLEYEKSQMENVDWPSIEKDDSVICPVCQKANLQHKNDTVSCENCNLSIKTQKSLPEIKKSIMLNVETHSAACWHEPQFALISEAKVTHIYLICNNCKEMNVIL